MRTRTGKNVIDMNMGELRDEVAHLQIQVERLAAKNKRRKTALKGLNKHALLSFKVRADYEAAIERLTARAEKWERRAEIERAEVVRLEHNIKHLLSAGAQNAGGVELPYSRSVKLSYKDLIPNKLRDLVKAVKGV